MKPGTNAFRLIKMFEGCRLKAYTCPAGLPTIGWGNTTYPDGRKVKLGDTISQERADSMLQWTAGRMGESVHFFLLNTQVNQNQLDAPVSWCWNVGVGSMAKSTLMKKVRNNPQDASIRDEFMRWNKAGGKELAGLTRRRKVEADLYFKPVG